MNLDSPVTPEGHSPKSPIWTSEITAIEAFYPASQSGYDLNHAFIVRDSERPHQWHCHATVSIPGIVENETERAPSYTTEEVVHMIRNPPESSTINAPRRARARRDAPARILKAQVCSIRLLYNGRYIFLDRASSDGYSWLGGGLSLTTAKIVAMLPYVYG